MIGKAHKKWQFESASFGPTPEDKIRKVIKDENTKKDVRSVIDTQIKKAGDSIFKSREQFADAHPNWASAEQSDDEFAKDRKANLRLNTKATKLNQAAIQTQPPSLNEEISMNKTVGISNWKKKGWGFSQPKE